MEEVRKLEPGRIKTLENPAGRAGAPPGPGGSSFATAPSPNPRERVPAGAAASGGPGGAAPGGSPFATAPSSNARGAGPGAGAGAAAASAGGAGPGGPAPASFPPAQARLQAGIQGGIQLKTVDMRSGVAAVSSSNMADQRVNAVEELVFALQKQIQGLMSERAGAACIEAISDVTDSRTEARLMAIERRLEGNQELENLAQKQVTLMVQVQGELVRLDEKHAMLSSSQEGITEKVVAWDVEMRQILDHVLAEIQSAAVQSKVAALEKDILSVRASSEAHEDLILNQDNLVRHFHEQLNMHKKQQDAAVKQFRSISNSFSKDLAALSADVKQFSAGSGGASRQASTVQDDSCMASPDMDRSCKHPWMALQASPSPGPDESRAAEVERKIEVINNKIARPETS